MLKQYVKHSYQSKFARVPLIHSGYKAHQDLTLASLPVSSIKEYNRKGGILCKISLVLQSPVPSPKA